MTSFNTLPHPISPSVDLKPFSISIPDAEIERLKVLLKNSPIAPPNIWNSRNDMTHGIPRDTLVELVNRWENEYDWRKWESTINSFPQYKVAVSDDDGTRYKVHFVGLFSKTPSAVPVVLLHGWPGSIVEFLPILLKLRSKYDPESLPIHIIAPHFIGFPFSDPPPLDKIFTHVDNARLISKTMHGLGFGESGYVVQGGDLGSMTATELASLDPACKLVHLNALPITPPPGTDVEADIKAGKYSPDEVESLMRSAEFMRTGNAFIKLDGNRPSTAGLLIGSNPVGLLAWLGEKMISWSDETPDTDLILTNVALYWFTGCYPTSIAHHRLIVDGDMEPLTGGWRKVTVPLGHSSFKKELGVPPQAWVVASGKVSWQRTHEKGGHFPALEEPDRLWKDIEDFITEFWGKIDYTIN